MWESSFQYVFYLIYFKLSFQIHNNKNEGKQAAVEHQIDKESKAAVGCFVVFHTFLVGHEAKRQENVCINYFSIFIKNIL